jgi:hypothetical protein
MEFFKNFAEALIESDRVKREADFAMDGKAVLTYMKVYMKESDAPHRRTAKYFCRVFGNAWLSDYHCFRESKKVSDLFPRIKNIEELKEALNIGRKYLKEAGWKLSCHEDHIEWSFKEFTFMSLIMMG